MVQVLVPYWKSQAPPSKLRKRPPAPFSAEVLEPAQLKLPEPVV